VVIGKGGVGRVDTPSGLSCREGAKAYEISGSKGHPPASGREGRGIRPEESIPSEDAVSDEGGGKVPS
jgi:hypothetical protein